MPGLVLDSVGCSGVMSQNFVSILAVTLTAITKLQPIDTSTSAGNVVDQPAVDQRLAVADDRHGEHGQVDALEDRMDGIAAFANYRVAAHQVDSDGEAGDGELFEFPVVQVLAKHWVEVPATVLV